MDGLVLELQRDALNKMASVTDLLRKAFVVSKKLQIVEMETWIRNELYGYENVETTIPDYRKIRGEVKVFNPYRGWQPLNMGSSKIAELLSTRHIGQPVSELDSLVNEHQQNILQVPFAQETKNQIMNLMKVPLEPSLLVPQTEIVGILDTIRNEILNWSLDLESRGILGDGMSFTKEEKMAASKITYQVTNNIQNMNNSQFQQDSAGATQTLTICNENSSNIKEFIKHFYEVKDSLDLDDLAKRELCTEVKTVELQLESPKPKQSIISESIKSIRSILEGVTGSIVATGLLALL
ncbi:AbiTii domain-containing protein [Photobacterium leiognathi]|uniref:AbiTii domain-containing protein n=1 Tax=Photobacterium leiognathi TaxID=553611 RepID=UPI002982344F|nr:hypothetical protein [Photobacterium leiognathi]